MLSIVRPVLYLILWRNSVKATTKPRTFEAEFRTKEAKSDGNAKLVRNAQEERTTKTPPREKSVYLERPATGERERRE